MLDTQIFIWWDSNSSRIPPRLLEMCQDESNILVLSAASVWELQIKSQLGKMELNRPLKQIIDDQVRINHIELLPIDISHIFGLEQLPSPHRDPFDRLIISQAVVEDIAIVSVDDAFQNYPVQVFSS